MERSYIAFISYRHLPLEMEVAKKLHRRIERFVIPRELRKNGEKKLGLVFRDQDELPISSNLTSNIEQALDRTKYLIVICSPATCQSLWVMREISYFIQHHDREHVLALLVDGTPETAFPPQLTEIRSETGELLQLVEPLAANIIADSRAKRNRLFQTESLRLLAVLTGCHYDALFRRELRYRRRRAGIIGGVSAAVAGAFIAMLLNRNAQIKAQLEQSQINESKTLAALSENAFREGDIDGALSSALQALPGADNQRPYVPEAEYALSRELGLYRTGEMAYRRTLQQESIISALVQDKTGDTLATGDDYGALRCWDSASGALLWQRQFTAVWPMAFVEETGLLAFTDEGLTLCSRADGSTLWQRPDLGILNLAGLSRDGTVGLCYRYAQSDDDDPALTLLDLHTGQDTESVPCPDTAQGLCDGGALSPDGRFAAMLVQEEGRAWLVLWDRSQGGVRLLEDSLPASAGAIAFRLAFTPAGDLLLACDSHRDSSWVRRYDSGADWAAVFSTEIDAEKVSLSSDRPQDQLAGVALLDGDGEAIVVGVKHDLYQLSPEGEIRWHRELSANLSAGRMYDKARLWLVLADGTVTFCTEDGMLTADMDIDCFRSGYGLSHAALAEDISKGPRAALVPEGAPQRAALVETVENGQMFQVGAFSQTISHTSMIASPSGDRVFALCQYPAGTAAEGIYMDAVEGATSDNLPLTPDGDLSDPGKLALTEDGMLITPHSLLDTRTGQTTPLSEGQDSPAMSADGSQIVTAWVESGSVLHLLRDGRESAAVPCPDGTWSLYDVGGSGYVLLSSEDGAFALYAPDGSWTAPDLPAHCTTALAANSPRLACWDGEQLSLLDLSAGSAVTGIDLPPTTVKLLYACGDTLLLCCSETGVLTVLDAATGEMLHRSEHAGENIHFAAAKARYRVFSTADDTRLLLCYDHLSRTEPVTLVLDRESRACVGAFDGVAVYLPARDSVLAVKVLDGFYLSRLWSREEMIALALERTGNSEQRIANSE